MTKKAAKKEKVVEKDMEEQKEVTTKKEGLMTDARGHVWKIDGDGQKIERV